MSGVNSAAQPAAHHHRIQAGLKKLHQDIAAGNVGNPPLGGQLSPSSCVAAAL
jgi:hypothetical protein